MKAMHKNLSRFSSGLSAQTRLTEKESSSISVPVTLRNFLSNLSRIAVARQVGGELHSVTWVVSQLLLSVARSVARRISCSNWQHHCTVYHPLTWYENKLIQDWIASQPSPAKNIASC